MQFQCLFRFGDFVQAEVEEAIEVLVEEELGMNPSFGEGH